MVANTTRSAEARICAVAEQHGVVAVRAAPWSVNSRDDIRIVTMLLRFFW